MPKLTWFFDLDNTLHDASYRVFATLDGSINRYIEEHLSLDSEAADRLRLDYWRRYGTTIAGLMRHHQVDARHFLAATHAFAETPELAGLLRFETGLARRLARLPGRKVLLTNAPARYAHAVVRRIGVQRQFASRYAIEQMQPHGRLRPKPSRAMLRMLLARERIAPRRAVLVEDSVANLKSARALGMRTVLVNGHTPPWGARRKSRPPYVDLQVKSISQLVSRHNLLG